MKISDNNQSMSTNTPPPQSNELPPTQGNANAGLWSEIVKFSIVAILIVVPIRIFIAQPFIVDGASMEPTFQSGQYLIVDQLSYNFEAPRRGDVIIFRFPEDTSKFFIKRVIGLPGETVELRGKDIIVKNDEHPSGIILNEPYLESDNRESTNTKETLESGEYYVLGDNRRASSDSRIWGPLSEEFIIGRAFFRLFPLTESTLLPGNFNNLEE